MKPQFISFVASFLLAAAQVQSALAIIDDLNKSKAGQSAGAGEESSPQSPSEPGGGQQEDCGCETDVPPEVVATMEGASITIGDIDEAIKHQLYNLQRMAIEARKNELEVQINSKLLDAEAKKRGMNAVELIDREVVSKIEDPTEEEVQEFYRKNKARLPREFNAEPLNLVHAVRQQRQSEGEKELAGRLRAAAEINILTKHVTPPDTEEERGRVFATVNGEPITSGDVEDRLKPLMDSIREQMYEMRRKELDRQINVMLLTREAESRNTEPRELLKLEVGPKVKKITEAEARAYYEQDKARPEGEFEDLKVQLIDYLGRREIERAEMAFAEELRRKASLRIFLKPPELSIYEIATDDQPSKGNPSAPVTLIEFTDYECQACAGAQPMIEELSKQYGSRLRVVVRDFPLQQHAHAFRAAEAAEAAREQGKYWEYAALLFKNQTELGIDKLKEYASRLGLDRDRFDAALESRKFARQVWRDLEDGMKIGVSATPTLFVNGRRISEKTPGSLKSAIEAALMESAQN